MYVRKFEADSLDAALKQIKLELGPDAIILKTVTNKGLKGAFKKNKIEITAAISEKSYVKKSNVDQVLDDGQKESFYSSPASFVSNMIDQKEATSTKPSANYSSLGLNKPVKQLKENLKSGLDDFLGSFQETKEEILAIPERRVEPIPQFEEENITPKQKIRQEVSAPTGPMTNSAYEDRISDLEQQLAEIAQTVGKYERKISPGIVQLQTSLRSLDISDEYINKLTQKALFDLEDHEQETVDTVFEYALSEMVEKISVGHPLFSSAEDESVITVLLSETSTGQTSMVKKFGALKEDSIVITSSESKGVQLLANQMLNIDIRYCDTVPEIVSEIRKAADEKRSIFVDYKVNLANDETKKFIDGLKRSFGKVEVLICLSSIHSEMYNRKVGNKYRPLADGIVLSHLDLCLNYGAIFNLAVELGLPYQFFGTGEVIPDDIEAATSERILAGLFQL